MWIIAIWCYQCLKSLHSRWWYYLFQTASKGFFYIWIYSERALSIHSDPYQALKIYYTKTKNKNCRKWKWEKLQAGVQHHKFWFYQSQLWAQSPELLAKSPSRPLNVGVFECKILILIKLDPSHHNSSNPPGLHLPGCLPPLQLPIQVTVKRGDLLPGHKQTN